MEEVHGKMPNILSLEKCKFKPQGNTPIRMAKFGRKKSLIIPNVDKNVKQLDPHTLLVGIQSFQKIVGQFLIKLYIHLSSDLEILL